MITAKTSLVCVIGDPIKHSVSPLIHNAALKEMNLNWCYMAIPCSENNLKLVLSALRVIDCKGINITIPHKSNALNYCVDTSLRAKGIGAVNTLIPYKNDSWLGDNTDIEGFIYPLKNKENWSNKSALILGSGGSAKAVFAGLKELGFKKISIAGRSKDSLNNFIKNLNFDIKDIEVRGLAFQENSIRDTIKESNLIINTTPVGMYQSNSNYNKTMPMPFGKEVWDNLLPNTILYDLVYNPNPTEWLKKGLEKNCEIIDGLEMLIQQGAASLRLWSGIKEIPIEEMRKAAKLYLKSKK